MILIVSDDDGCILDPDKDWTEYWRILFKKVTLEDVKKFEEKFRGSTEEEEELKNAYMESEVRIAQSGWQNRNGNKSSRILASAMRLASLRALK